jgi:hypothetical protein
LRKDSPTGDYSGRTVGTWRVLYEVELRHRTHYMCQCAHCGVRKYIMALKIRKGYALRCRECRIREDQELIAV